MSEQVKAKVELNKVTHSVRAAQAVLQYGVGAMVDFPDQTLVTAAPEYWSGTSRIYDDRFAKALGVDYFALPTNIAYARFPEWYFCPKCRRFQPLKNWVSEYRKTAKPKTLERDEYMAEHMQCPRCRQDLVVARIVTVCESGHLNSSLVIPPYADKLNAKIEQSKAYDDCMTIISDEDPEEKIATITRRLPKWVDKIALEIGAPHAEVEKILTQKWLDPVPEGVDVTGIQYRVEEYTALSGEVGAVGSGLGDFSREEMDISEYGLPHIKAISLIDKVRVVNALIGFSRIQLAMTRNDVGFVDVKDPDTRWYPAYEVRGEGIFIFHGGHSGIGGNPFCGRWLFQGECPGRELNPCNSF